jgi:hypothetical protein
MLSGEDARLRGRSFSGLTYAWNYGGARDRGSGREERTGLEPLNSRFIARSQRARARGQAGGGGEGLDA